MSSDLDRLVVGTRGSELARTQTSGVVSLIRDRFPGLNVDMRVISTEGDRVRDLPLAEFGDKGVFVRNLEGALLSGAIDVAVHSLKDVPSDIENDKLCLTAYSVREDPRDALVSRHGHLLAGLPSGARVGTGSLRRRVQLLSVRPDVVVADIRGNVDTRLRKLNEGDYDALILAAAGLKRLHRHGNVTEYLTIDTFTPDAGQGILAMQTRVEPAVQRLLAEIDDESARTAAGAERACVRALGADCRSPVGVYATLDGETLTLRGMAAAADAAPVHRRTVVGPREHALDIGLDLGQRLLAAIRAA